MPYLFFDASEAAISDEHRAFIECPVGKSFAVPKSVATKMDLLSLAKVVTDKRRVKFTIDGVGNDWIVNCQLSASTPMEDRIAHICASEPWAIGVICNRLRMSSVVDVKSCVDEMVKSGRLTQINTARTYRGKPVAKYLMRG